MYKLGGGHKPRRATLGRSMNGSDAAGQSLKKGRFLWMLQRVAMSSDASYRTAMCVELGQPLQVKHVPRIQTIGKDQVRVAVKNAGINFADILQISGKYQEKQTPPYTPGSEFAGLVTEVGENVHEFQSGQRVFGVCIRTKNGSFAEEAIVPSHHVTALPEEISFPVAAGMFSSYMTAWVALHRIANVQPNDVVLVTAAAGSVGLAAVDVAVKVLKARVIGACGGPEKCALVKKYGAEAVIDYNYESIRDRVKEITNGKGADIIVDQVGGKVFEECMRSIAFEGKIIVVGFTSGDIPQVPANILLVKNFSVCGLYMGSYRFQHPEFMRKCSSEFLQCVKKGIVKPHTSIVFPLSEINKAFHFIKDRKSTGKVLLDCSL